MYSKLLPNHSTNNNPTIPLNFCQTLYSMFLTPTGNIIVVGEVQSEKAQSPISVVSLGMMRPRH